MAHDPNRDLRLAQGGLAVTTAVTAFALWAAYSSRSFVAAGVGLHLVACFWVWLGVLLTARREVKARDEALESQRLAALAAEGRRALFDGEQRDDEGARALTWFRRVGHPVITLILAALVLAGAGYLFKVLPVEEPRPNLAMSAVFGGAAFALLLLGRYAFVLARQGGVLAGAGGRRAISGALVTFLACLATAAGEKGLTQADQLGYVYVAIEVLLALEALLLLVLEAYRPRRPGEVPRPPFDSRLLGLLSSPGDVARSIARAVDYQFGFSISQTWFYRFLSRWVVPLVAFTLISFWLLSALVVVEPHQQTLVRRLGRLQPQPLGPGLHFKLPWPLDQTEAVAATRLHSVHTGRDRAAAAADADAPILWTVRPWKVEESSAAEAENLVLIARESAREGETPVNLVSAAATVHYRVADPKTFAERAQDPGAVLEVLAERELCFLFGGEDLDRLLRERTRHAIALRERLQAIANERLALGLSVESTLLTDLQPPVAVGRAFEEPTAAQEQSLAEVLRARVERIRLEQRSKSEAEWIAASARLDAAERLALAAADARRFGSVRALSEANPRLFRLTRLLEELGEGARGKRKVVLGKGSALTQLDLQEKVAVEELGQALTAEGGQNKEDE